MAKKVNDVKDGDLKSNVVVLRSVYVKLARSILFSHKEILKLDVFQIV